MPNVIHFVSLEIGHESPVPDTAMPGKSQMQMLLERLLVGDKAPSSWTTPTDITVNDPITDDFWVPGIIATMITAALKSGSIRLDESHLRQLRNASDPQHLHKADGSPGTRCKLVGDKWINSRSYKLYDGNGAPWPPNPIPATAMVFATLSWRCWPR